MSECQECGMIVSTDEYHPYAACVLFKHLRQGDKVRELIWSVQRDSSTRLQRAEELLREARHWIVAECECTDNIDAFLGENHD